MKAILVVSIDDSYVQIKNESVILKRGTITYRDLNNNPYSIEINNFCLKPLPHKDFTDEAAAYQTEEEYKAYVSGWNDCIDEIIGEENDKD